MKLLRKSLALMIGTILLLSPTVLADPSGMNHFPDPTDEETWVLPEDMTWDDYKPVPGVDWNNPPVEPERVIKGAIILVDFQDQEFITSQPKGSDVAGNPVGEGNVSRDELSDYWVDFLNKPQLVNNYRTIDEYWRENSFGKWGVELDGFGPYKLEGHEFEYGLSYGNEMPPGFQSKDIKPEAMELAESDLEASGEEYDFTFILHAGYDQSGVWQEFGEMMFNDRFSVTDEFGPPAYLDDLPNWANTRYVPWTSWFAAKSIWSHADIRNGISVQGENDGMGTFAHEFGHIMQLLDNYNNPYAEPVSRSYSGPWELMSRGSFNGPGGPHTRWMITPTEGGSAPSHHMLRNKIKQGFLAEDDYLNLDRDELAETGPVTADIIARSVPTGEEFGRTGLHGINIEMEDLTPANSLDDDWRADMQRGEKWYDNYTVEVIDRIGFDSFTPDSGVLMAKTKNAESAPNIWVVDANDEDIEKVDFIRPDGTEAMYSLGDYRQLSDALFKAGTDENVVSEYVDEHNRLHFYVLDKEYDDEGVLSYRVSVRHLDGAGDFERGISAETGTVEYTEPGKVATQYFSITNTGEATDLIRISVETDSDWETMIEHNVIEVEPGEKVDVPVYVEVPEGEEEPAKLTMKATSETDFEQVAVSEDVLLSEISPTSIKELIKMLEQMGDIAKEAESALTMHITAVEHFEKQKDNQKVIKHMQGFKHLIEHYSESDLMTDKAFEALEEYANILIDR